LARLFKEKRKGQLKERHLHLGLDFGTCYSKLVLRDYDAREDKCLVIVPEVAGQRKSNYLIPSLVVLWDGCLHFGFQAQEIASRSGAIEFCSVKIRAAYPDSFKEEAEKLPKNFTYEDLSILVILYLLQVSDHFAKAYAMQFNATPKLTMTTGAPMGALNQSRLQGIFLRMARSAYEAFGIKGLPQLQGIKLEQASEFLKFARDSITKQSAFGDPRDWVRSEAEAALLWAYRSPKVGPGLYACVDIGAGSTDSTFFKIVNSYEGKPGNGVWLKDRMAFFGAVSEHIGMDDIGHAICRHTSSTITSVRGKEEHMVKNLPNEVLNPCNKICETYQKAFSRGYELDKRVSAWKNYGLFLIGGGSNFSRLRSQLHNMSVWPGQLSPPKPCDPGQPKDLKGPDGKDFIDDPSFLLVAYGLSHYRAEVPLVTNPSDIQPLKIERPTLSIDHENFYSKK